MNHPTPQRGSQKVHHLVEHIRSRDFWLETAELLELGVMAVLEEVLGIEVVLTPRERSMVEEELMKLAEANEIREGQIKYRELFPADKGEEIFRSHYKRANEHRDSTTSYVLPFSYPVDENLRQVKRSPSRASFSLPQKKPAAGSEVNEMRNKLEKQALDILKKSPSGNDIIREQIRKESQEEEENWDGPPDICDQAYEAYRDEYGLEAVRRVGMAKGPEVET